MNTKGILSNPTDRMLRQFAGMWIIFLTALAERQEFHYQRHVVALLVAGLGVTVGVLGMASPRAIRFLFVGSSAIAYPIGWVVSRIVLGIIFYGLFTPLAGFFHLIGRDALRLKPQRTALTYWHPKPSARDKSQYLYQF
jgi:Saxitoxin biosynthesis operon protein SxtJ